MVGRQETLKVLLDDPKAVLDAYTSWRTDVGQQLNILSDLVVEQAHREEILDLPHSCRRALRCEGGRSKVGAQRRSRCFERVVEGVTRLLVRLEELTQLLETVIHRCHGAVEPVLVLGDGIGRQYAVAHCG